MAIERTPGSMKLGSDDLYSKKLDVKRKEGSFSGKRQVTRLGHAWDIIKTKWHRVAHAVKHFERVSNDRQGQRLSQGLEELNAKAESSLNRYHVKVLGKDLAEYAAMDIANHALELGKDAATLGDAIGEASSIRDLLEAADAKSSTLRKIDEQLGKLTGLKDQLLAKAREEDGLIDQYINHKMQSKLPQSPRPLPALAAKNPEIAQQPPRLVVPRTRTGQSRSIQKKSAEQQRMELGVIKANCQAEGARACARVVLLQQRYPKSATALKKAVDEFNRECRRIGSNDYKALDALSLNASNQLIYFEALDSLEDAIEKILNLDSAVQGNKVMPEIPTKRHLKTEKLRTEIQRISQVYPEARMEQSLNDLAKSVSNQRLGVETFRDLNRDELGAWVEAANTYIEDVLKQFRTAASERMDKARKEVKDLTFFLPEEDLRPIEMRFDKAIKELSGSFDGNRDKNYRIKDTDFPRFEREYLAALDVFKKELKAKIPNPPEDVGP